MKLEEYTDKPLPRYGEPGYQQIFGKHMGNWYLWQHENIHHDIQMSTDRYKRFSQFVSEMAPEPYKGVVHLHSMYDQRAGATYWKVTTASVLCKMPGRCRKMMLNDLP